MNEFENDSNNGAKEMSGASCAVLAVFLVMFLLPNAGSLSDVFWVAMTLGAFILMLLDTSLNMAMQPFKMMVGDIVNEKQKGLAYALQSFLCNAG